MARPLIVVILGPTASGKSALAVRIALRLCLRQAKKFYGINGCEIVSADSRQVYRHLDIGTGKTTKEEMRGIPHHCIDIADPKKIFTVDEYRRKAEHVIADIYARGKIPIVAGGTGFYIDAILYGASYPETPPNWKRRSTLEKQQTQRLFKTLQRLDSQRAVIIDPHNRRRLIRAIEIIKTIGWIPVPLKKHRFDALILGIKTDPVVLRKKISKRLTGWLKAGLIDEVQQLHTRHKLPWHRLEEIGLDYKYVARYLRGTLKKEDMISKIDTEIWRYAKRQMTYFKKIKNVHWIDTSKEAEKLVKEFLQ